MKGRKVQGRKVQGRKIQGQMLVVAMLLLGFAVQATAWPGAPVFGHAGGSDNPYNFNGVGYNGVPSEPQRSVFSFNFSDGSWQLHGDLPHATMDHRGLPYANGWYYLIGGMQEKQTSVSQVYRFRLDTF